MSDFLAYESEEGFTPRIHFDKLEDVIRRLFTEAERLKREETGKPHPNPAHNPSPEVAVEIDDCDSATA